MASKANGTPNRKSKADSTQEAQPAVPQSQPNTPDSAQPLPYELVSELAYQKYLSRGESHGSDVQDWLDAEREVAASHKNSPN